MEQHAEAGELNVGEQGDEPVPLSPLQALRQRLGLGFGDAMSQEDIDRFIARRRARKDRHPAD